MDKLSRSPDELRAEHLRGWISSIPGVCPIRDVQARKRCKVAGVIKNIRLDPHSGGGAIEATIMDGTGQMKARWLGRTSLSGIRLGVGLVMEGAPGETEGGEAVILNPLYELVPDPEHG